MGRTWHINYILRQAWGVLIGGALCLYFAVNAFKGDHSLRQLRVLEAQHHELETVMAQTGAERSALERRLAALQADALDPDLLEELVRGRLGFAHPDELVILLPQADS